MTEINNAVTVVTGASRGIGVHLAKALAQRGARLALAARSEAELHAVRDELVSAGHRAIAVVADVAVEADRKRLVETTEAELGPVDILVNNAGIETTQRFATSDPADLERILEVNLVAPMLLTRSVLPGMVARNRGHVVNISSAAGKIGPPFLAPYAASKFGLVGLTQALHAEHHGTDVRFTAVCPAFVTDTGMYHRWEQQGVKSSKIAGTANLGKVIEATVRCIEENKLEALVNTPPIKPLVVLATIAPQLAPRIFKLTGFYKTLEGATRLGR